LRKNLVCKNTAGGCHPALARIQGTVSVTANISATTPTSAILWNSQRDGVAHAPAALSPASFHGVNPTRALAALASLFQGNSDKVAGHQTTIT
jgi:hypothetical protein